MDRTERISLLHGLLSSHRRGLSNDRLMQEAGCSRTTLYRDLGHLLDTLGAPLVHDGQPSLAKSLGLGPQAWRHG